MEMAVTIRPFSKTGKVIDDGLLGIMVEGGIAFRVGCLRPVDQVPRLPALLFFKPVLLGVPRRCLLSSWRCFSSRVCALRWSRTIRGPRCWPRSCGHKIRAG